MLNPDFRALRRRRNALHGRIAAAEAAIAKLRSIKVELSSILVDQLALQLALASDYDEDSNFLKDHYGKSLSFDILEEAKDKEHQLFSALSLAVLTRDYKTTSTVIGGIRNIEEEIGTAALIQEPSEDPSFAGWAHNEILAMARHHRAAILDATQRLRAGHVRLKYLQRHRSALPESRRSACLGMFGNPDWNSRHVYSDSDFDEMSAHRRIPDPNAPEKTVFVNILPNVMSPRWFAPFIGDERAELVSEAMTILEESLKPLPHEPDTPSHISFPSRDSFVPDFPEIPSSWAV